MSSDLEALRQAALRRIAREQQDAQELANVRIENARAQAEKDLLQWIETFRKMLQGGELHTRLYWGYTFRFFSGPERGWHYVHRNIAPKIDLDAILGGKQMDVLVYCHELSTKLGEHFTVMYDVDDDAHGYFTIGA